jgi:predicted short-subunit dehydrogenase-like oxidoreductase (DUF2520 family)
MAAKLTRLTHKIAIQLHLLAESCIICSSHSRRRVRKLLDTLAYPARDIANVTYLESLNRSLLNCDVGVVSDV